jgi:hypothetical protein
MRTSTILCLMCSLALPACSDPPDESGEAGSTSDDDGGSSSDSGDVLQCPAQTGPGVRHAENIDVDTVWRAEDGPHHVDANIAIRSGATLEIEPCAIVRLAADVELDVAFPGTPNSGHLVAEGTVERPIRFEPAGPAPWGRIFIAAPGDARLAHVTLTGGGATDPAGATIAAEGTGTLPLAQGLLVDHVTIEDSAGAGVSLMRKTAFAPGSTALVVRDCGSDAHPFPLEIDEHALDSLPEGSYTGNAIDEIFVDPLDHLQVSGAIHDRGVPYRVGNASNDRLVVGGGDRIAPPVLLTIEPGVTLRFFPGTEFAVEFATGDFAATGALSAVGTAERPIVFTSAAEAPAPGDWVGLWFGGVVDPRTAIAHARIEYTGADCGCILLSCSDIDAYEGAVIMTQAPPDAFVTDTVIAHAAGHGFVLGYEGAAVDFGVTNDFEDVAGCAMTLPRPGSCPDPLPACE